MIDYFILYISKLFNENFTNLGLSESIAEAIVRTAMIIAILIVSWFVYKLVQGPLMISLEKISRNTNQKWDNILVDKRVFQRFLNFIPLTLIYIFSSKILEGTEVFAISKTLINVLFIILAMLTIDALLSAILTIYEESEISREISITPFVQVMKLALYFICGILLLSILLEKTPFYFLSGLGALTAVLMFVFKDILMGFVAGIQLIGNKMIAPKDWIEMPKYGADGDVIELTLTTVKVKNFDNTITTIPTYALINESFKNWRNMNLSGGRRIKRHINIDLSSIKFCNSEMLARFTKIKLITQVIHDRQIEINAYNQENNIDDSVVVNGRRLTNIGIFRTYVDAYLRQHPKISNKMTFLVRQLSPRENGLPIEIYVFCKETKWDTYEEIQADIFDHILAVVPEFDLKVFQEPSGNDFKNIGNKK